MSCATILTLLLMALSGCANWAEDGGVENQWRAENVPAWTAGRSTNNDVMAALGPPSQILNLDDQVVYYYMRQKTQGKGYYFLVYNTSREVTRYDRAIFFFDREGTLLRHAYSQDSLPLDEK